MAAVNKKVSAKAAPKPQAKAGKPAKAAAKPGKPVKGAKGAKGGSAKKSKAWLVPVIMLAVLAIVGGQIYLRARYLASLKFDMVRLARTIPQGRDRGQSQAVIAIAGDKADNTYVMEGNDGTPYRLQKFDKAQSPDSQIFEPKKPEQMVTGAVDMDVDGPGDAYVLLRNGNVVEVGPDMKWKATFKSGLQSGSAVTVDSTGAIYVASAEENKVVILDVKGDRTGEFGAPGTNSGNLVAPVRMRATADDEIVVVERGDNGLRGKVFTKEHALRKTFLIENLQNCEPVKLGVNGEGRAFLNDHMGSRGIIAFDLATGKFFGESQITKDGEKFISPGALGANRFNSTVFVHTITGLIKCSVPSKDDKAEGGN
jgi:hypothetical protein